MGDKMTTKITSLILVWVMVAAFCANPAPARATGLEVEAPFDDAQAHDDNPGDGLCRDLAGSCTLRAAIEEANALPGADTVTFQVPMTITINSGEGALPTLYQETIIDASAHSVLGRPGVTLNGAGGAFDGLTLQADSCQIYGLHLTNFGGSAISISSAYNQIGDIQPSRRNVLSGNGVNGLLLLGSNAHHNDVYNNWIGLAMDGQTAAPNWSGVAIMGAAHDNDIGGETAGTGNHISGNTYHGVYINGTGCNYNRLGDNTIGLTAVNALPQGNGLSGVTIRDGAQYNNIGITPLLPNTIQYNSAHGISIENSALNKIAQNSIAYNSGDGVRIDGASASGNDIFLTSIHHNGGLGIHLLNGANGGIAAPTISAANDSSASGQACAQCTVRVYSDSSDEGETYQGWAKADASGNWYYSGALTGPYVTATSTDENAHNVSQFSAPFSIGGGSHRVLLPLVFRNY
jgi:hypothetical protein